MAAPRPATGMQTATEVAEPLLSVRGLVTEFVTPAGVIHAVNDVSV